MTTEAGVASAGAKRSRTLEAVLVLLLFVVLCGLGVWQVLRLGQKTRFLQQIAALQTAPSQPLNVVLNRVGDRGQVDFVRVQALCPALQQTPALRLYALQDGIMGRRLITACPLASGPYRSILVDRGFVAQERLGEVRVGPVLAVPITGVLRRSERAGWLTPANHPDQNDWRSRDIPAMASALHASAPVPLMLMLEAPAPVGFGPTPAPVPTRIPNNHLGYAITWFGLAIALMIMWIVTLRRPRRSEATPR